MRKILGKFEPNFHGYMLLCYHVITLRKLRFRQKTGFRIKTTCIEKIKCTWQIVVLILLYLNVLFHLLKLGKDMLRSFNFSSINGYIIVRLPLQFYTLHFAYWKEYRCLNKILDQIERKWMVASFSNFFGKIRVGFCLNIRKKHLLEFSF